MTRFLSQYWRIILFILALFLILWLVWTLLSILLPFIIGLILAYLLLPPIRWIESRLPAKHKLVQTKRVALIILVYLLVLALIGLIGYLTIPPLINSITEFITNLPKILPDFISRIQNWTNSLRQLLPPQIQSQVDSYLSNLLNTIASAAQSGFAAGFSYLTASFGFILGFVSLPVFLFFLMKDAEKLNAGFYEAFSTWLREHVQGVVQIFRDILGRYIRASIVLGIAVAILDFIGLEILGIPFAPALAFWAGLTELIPILGPWIGGAAGVIVTLATDTSKVFWVIALYFIVQTLEGNVLVPRIHSQYLNLHPAIILILLVIGGHFGGLWGIILVVPLAATFVALFKYLAIAIRNEGLLKK